MIIKESGDYMACIFCEKIEDNKIIKETDYFKIIFDINPIQKGHVLVISKKHLSDLRELNSIQIIELVNIEKKILDIFDTFSNILGGTIIQNNGETMDKNTHFHIHIVPRYVDDCFWQNQDSIQNEININLLERLISEG